MDNKKTLRLETNKFQDSKIFYSDDLLWQKKNALKGQNPIEKAASENHVAKYEEDINEVVNAQDQSSWLRITVTFCIYASGILVGVGSGVVGPTLVHITMLYDCTTSEMSRGIAVMNVTYFFGSLLTALVFDFFNPRLFHTLALLCIGLSLGVAPFMPHLYGYQAMMAAMTFGQGIVQSSVPGILLHLWKGHKLKAPILQSYYAFWSVGAFLAPIIAIPFLVEIPQNCRDLHEVSDVSTEYENGAVYVNTTTDNTSSLYTLQNADKCSIDVSQVQKVYVIIAGFGLCVTCLYGFVFVTNKPSITVRKSPNKTQISNDNAYSNSNVFKYIIISGGLLFNFFLNYFLYVTSVFLSSFAIIGLRWSVNSASLLTSLFTGSQGLGRVLAIPLVYFLKPGKLVTAYLTVSLLAYTIMIFIPITNDSLMWLIVVMAGVSGSPMMAVVFIWIGQYTQVTSAVGAAVLMAASIGGFSAMILMGKLFELNHMWMAYIGFIAVLCNIVLFIALNVFLKFAQKLFKNKADEIRKSEIETLRSNFIKCESSRAQQLVSSQVSLF